MTQAKTASETKEQAEEEGESQKVREMLQNCLEDLDAVPHLAVKFCCHQNRSEILATILEQFPSLDRSGTAYRTKKRPAAFELELEAIFGQDRHYKSILGEIDPPYGISPLNIAILNKHESIIKLILDRTSYDVCSDISKKTLETCIHTACRVAVDTTILQALLSAVRSQLCYDKVQVQDFLDKLNGDGLKASDYCAFKSRHDFVEVLQEFAESSEQQVISIKWYDIQSDYSLNSKRIAESPQYKTMLNQDTRLQYKREMVGQYLAENKGYKFNQSLRTQVSSVAGTPY